MFLRTTFSLRRLPVLAALCALACALPSGSVAAMRGTPLAPRTLGALAGVLTAPLAFAILLELGSGRRTRVLVGQKWPIALLALLASAVAAVVVARSVARARAPSRAAGYGIVLGLLSIVCVVLDAQLLRRLYPALHWALATAAIASALLSSYVLLRTAPAVASRVGWTLLVMLALAQPWAFERASSVPSVRMALELAAPLSGKLVWLSGEALGRKAPVVRAKQPAVAKTATQGAGVGAGLDLRGHDVLLVTVDALRADRLRAYGGAGLTPDPQVATSMLFAGQQGLETDRLELRLSGQ